MRSRCGHVAISAFGTRFACQQPTPSSPKPLFLGSAAMYHTLFSRTDTQLDTAVLWSGSTDCSSTRPSRIIAPAATADFLQRLHTALSVEHVMGLLAEQIGRAFAFAGLHFHCPQPASRCRFGRPALHSASYELQAEQRDLGEVTLYRDASFTENELRTLENLLALVGYPLRNALLYHEALERATRDPLTGLLNRSTLTSQLQHEIARAQRLQQPLTLLIADIDHFKQINDHFGHDCGDEVLSVVAKRLQDGMRESDLLFRFGGEEFLMILPNTNAAGGVQLADRLRRAVRDTSPYPSRAANPQVSISIGVAELKPPMTADQWFRHADSALRYAKQAGRNRVHLSQD